MSNEITEDLDKVEYIKEQYFLEVSSPGVERVIRKDWQLEIYLQEEINIKLFKKDERNNKDYQGILKSFDEEKLIIYVEEKEISIERKNISLIKTVYNW